MGVNLKDLLERTPVALDDLAGKIIAIDTFNMIFQFLSTIRTRDGALLRDSKERVTSHLIGLFSRTTHFMQVGIKPVFVFDGEAPKLKRGEQERRFLVKKEAESKYKKAAAENNIEEMRKYATRTTHLSEEMVEDAKKLLDLLGLPVVQAPSEGESQAAHIVKNNDAWAVASQDYDSLVAGAPRLIQNLSITGKKKRAKTLAYTTVHPELIDLKQNLQHLKINQDQLIMLAMLVGTDYNPKGIKGIGPKNALKLVQQQGNPEELFKTAEWDKKSEVGWREIWQTIKDMPVTNNYKIKFSQIDILGLKKFLVNEHDFGLERVESTIKNLQQKQEQNKQKGLESFG